MTASTLARGALAFLIWAAFVTAGLALPFDPSGFSPTRKFTPIIEREPYE